jgi:hypothetical protein
MTILLAAALPRARTQLGLCSRVLVSAYSEHGHYINMSDPDYTQVACGFHETADDRVRAIQSFH